MIPEVPRSRPLGMLLFARLTTPRSDAAADLLVFGRSDPLLNARAHRNDEDLTQMVCVEKTNVWRPFPKALHCGRQAASTESHESGIADTPPNGRIQP